MSLTTRKLITWSTFILLCAIGILTFLYAYARTDTSPMGAAIEINRPNTFQSGLSTGSDASDLMFDVPAVDAGRLQVQLRITAKDAEVALIDPNGITRVTSLQASVVFQPRAALSRPELGDMILLPEQHNPLAGRWRLHIAYPVQHGDQSALVTVSLVRRYAVNLVSNMPASSAGEPIILTVLPMDNGMPVPGLVPHVTISRKDGKLADTIVASESTTSPTGIRLSNEPGVYIAVYTPAMLGVYQFCPHVTFANGTQVGGNCIQVKVSGNVGD